MCMKIGVHQEYFNGLNWFSVAYICQCNLNTLHVIIATFSVELPIDDNLIEFLFV
jgi:hypothetical protein